MRLHVFLLLFIITTDKTLASSHQLCGGDVALDQESPGRISLSPPVLFIDTSTPVSRRASAPPVCTWTIRIPQGRTVLLKLVWLDVGSSISVRCVWDRESQVLERGQAALLSCSGRNKAEIAWTGAGPSSEAAQLAYYVQEDERNSSEGRPTRRPDRVLVRRSQTGTSFTSAAPVGQELVRGTDGVRGRLYEGLEPQSVSGASSSSSSSSSSQDQGLPNPTSPQQGLPVAGGTDRETLPLPEEKPNNGADTSAAAHLTDTPMTAREGTHPYFRHALTTDTANTSNENAQTALTDATASNSKALRGTDVQKYNLRDEATQTVQSVSGSSTERPSRTTWESKTILIPRGRAASGTPGHKHFWRSQRSTDTLDSDLTSATTFGLSKASTKPPQHESSSADTDTEPTSLSSSSSPQGSGRTHSPTTHVAELNASVGTGPAASVHPNISQGDSFVTNASDVTAQTAAFQLSAKSDETLPTPASTSHSHATSPQSTQSVTHSPHTSSTLTRTSAKDKQASTESAQTHFTSEDATANAVSSRRDVSADDERTPGFTGSVSTPRAAPTTGDVVQNSAATGTARETSTLPRDGSPTDSSTSVPLLSSGASVDSSTPSYMLQTHTLFPDSSHGTVSTSSVTQPAMQTTTVDHKTTLASSQTWHKPQTQRPLQTSTKTSPTHTQAHSTITTPTTRTSVFSLTTIKSGEKEDKVWQWSPSSTTTNTPTSGPPKPPLPGTTVHPSQKENLTLTPSVLTSAWSSTKSPTFYIVPDQPAAIRVESIELLLQIVVEESRSAFTAGLEEDTAAWVEPYLQKAPGFSRLLGVWSSGHAVQSLVEFKTSKALPWLSTSGPTSLLERTGLAQAAREGRTFRSSKIANITLGGLQGDVCHWLLQCPSGYKCVSPPVAANYSCSSVCRFDYCHHHGICTHHPGQLPVCRCLVGDDFWYMGQRCDMRMTRARLVGACLAILVVMVTVIGVLAFVAVRRYRAMLIQAKVDQTRSSYRRFNHFDELSGRFWLRSWAGSADSLDNPAFTRSDELLHLRALDRPCCYHDDTLSLASTCPSHGAHINTIYPHSSQYGWRGSEMSMGDGVLDSGKASDLSVCSWPVEPIHWTPFPLLQQLASHRTPTVRVSRPRSYCEGMELVDLGKSWTA